MKKFLISLMILGMFLVGLSKPVLADGAIYTLAVTTYDVVGSSVNYYLGAYPNISGTVDLGLLVLSVSSNTSYDSTVAQTITIYNNAGSSTTTLGAVGGTAVATFVLPNNTFGFYQPIGVTGLNYNYKIRLTDLAIKKSSVASTVNAVFIYR